MITLPAETPRWRQCLDRANRRAVLTGRRQYVFQDSNGQWCVAWT